MSSPIITATLQAAFLSALSNILAQTFQAHQNHKPLELTSIDPKPLLHFVLFALISTPPNFYWQEYLESLWPAYVQTTTTTTTKAPSNSSSEKNPTSKTTTKQTLSIPNTFKKFFLDQLIGGPLNNVLFLLAMGYFAGMDQPQLIGYVKNEFWDLQKAGMKVWPLASMLGFLFVPVERRAAFGALVGIGWNVYLGLVMGE